MYLIRTWTNLGAAYGFTFLVMTVFNSTFTILPLYILELGGSEWLAGVQTAAFFAVAVILRFYFGPLADRIGRRLPLAIGISLFALTSLLFSLSHSLLSLSLVRMLQGVALSAFLSSSVSAVADMAPKNRLGFFIGIYRIFSTLSLLAGPAAAIYVATRFGYSAWFLICTLLAIVALGFLFLIRFPDFQSHTSHLKGHPMIAALQLKNARAIYLGISLTSIGYGALLSFATVHLSRTTDLNNPGMYFTLLGLASFFFTLISGSLSDHWGRAQIAWPLTILLGISVSLLFWIHREPHLIIVISSVLAGIGFNGGLSVFSAWLVEETPEEGRASALSLQENIIDMAIGGISLFMGLLAAFLPLGLTFLLVGMIVALPAVMMLSLLYPDFQDFRS